MVDNLNILQNKDFRLEINRLPMVKYFLQKTNVPGISVGTANVPSPFTDVRLHGDKPEFELLTADFMIDEDLRNWEELFNWIVSYSTPESFASYASGNVTRSQLHASKYSDATLFTTSNKYNGNVKFKFINLFPISISALPLNLDVTDADPIVCSVTFAYETFKIDR